MEQVKKIIILGATGGCVDILDAILDVNSALGNPRYDCIGFLDDDSSMWGKEVLGAKVLGPFSSAAEFAVDCYFVTGIGSPYNFWKRGYIIAQLGIPPERFETIVHPTASVSSTAKLGLGCVIFQHVTVTRDVAIGNHVLILPNTVISHGDTIGDYSIINAGACISGNVKIGRSCYLGAKSSVRQDVTIGEGSQVGMGSVVLQDIPENAVFVGSPAKFLRHTRQEEE